MSEETQASADEPAKASDRDGDCWMYHKDCPDGRVFTPDEEIPKGWKDAPIPAK